jgi:hypothetical protein
MLQNLNKTRNLAYEYLKSKGAIHFTKTYYVHQIEDMLVEFADQVISQIEKRVIRTPVWGRMTDCPEGYKCVNGMCEKT